MIHTNRIVTVGEQESIIDRPIVLYRGDREVEIEFTLVGNEFTFSEEGNVIKSVNASHGQLVLNTPSGEHMFSELAECHEGKVVFVVTKEMIDEFIEMGFYSFQIRLYDSAEMKSRVTIPPVMNGFDIRNPIAAEDETNVVDQGIVDYARIFKDQSNEELPTFTWDGEYVKTEWAHHDVITENKMNKIEDALYSINANIKESDVVMLNTLDQVKKDADAYVKEHMAEVEADVEDFERNLNTDVQQFKMDTNAAMTAHKKEVGEELNMQLNLLIPENDINTIYVDAINGSDSNDGTELTPVKTAVKGFALLNQLGSKALFKQWKIKFMPGEYHAVKVNNLPQFSKNLLIEGSRDDNGNITSIFRYVQNSYDYIGIWMEPMRGVAVVVSDLKFIGYTKGFNGYGLLGKNHGYMLIKGCEAENCDCGFAGINNTTITAQQTIVRNSNYGFRCQYCSSGTIGAGTGGQHMSDGGNGCEIYDCGTGILVTRNSVAHSDYVKFFNCDIGLKMDMNTRVASLANVYSGCGIGVKAEGGAEWIAGMDDEIDIWEDCEIPYQLTGNARHSRVQSLYCKNESLFLCVLENGMTVSEVKNTTSKTEVFRSSPSTGSLPQYYLDAPLTKVRVVIYGQHLSPEGTKTVVNATLRGLNNDNTVNGANISFGDVSLPVKSASYGGFKIEYDMVFTNDNCQRAYTALIGNTTGGNRIVTGPYTYNTKAATEGKKQLMVYVTPESAANSIIINRIEMYITN